MFKSKKNVSTIIINDTSKLTYLHLQAAAHIWMVCGPVGRRSWHIVQPSHVPGAEAETTAKCHVARQD